MPPVDESDPNIAVLEVRECKDADGNRDFNLALSKSLLFAFVVVVLVLVGFVVALLAVIVLHLPPDFFKTLLSISDYASFAA